MSRMHSKKLLWLRYMYSYVNCKHTGVWHIATLLLPANARIQIKFTVGFSHCVDEVNNRNCHGSHRTGMRMVSYSWVSHRDGKQESGRKWRQHFIFNRHFVEKLQQGSTSTSHRHKPNKIETQKCTPFFQSILWRLTIIH